VGLDQIDAFPPTPPARVDVLFVVDDGPSSGPLQGDLANAFSGFVSALAGVGADWQVAVIDASSPTFQGPIIRASPTATGQFQSQTSTGTAGFGTHQGIDRAYEATLPGGDAGPGSSFLRADAALSIVFVSHRPDRSTVTPQQAYAHWLSLKGGDADKVVVSGIVPPPPNGGFDTLIGLAGGIQLDATAPVTGSDLASIAIASIPGPNRLLLSAVPVPETLLVRADGVPYPNVLYDRSTNEIEFVTRPPAGSFVNVEYVEDCEGVFGGCSDGIDNDNDGLVDHPADPGCLTPHDASETDPVIPPTCANGADDDADGLADFPFDAECASAAHPYETCTEIDGDVYGYRVCEETGAASACPDLTAGPALALGDEGAELLPLGFAFDLYGTPYTEVYVGANGTLIFELPLSPPHGTCLPTPLGPTIAVWWDDLDPAGAGVWTRTGGAAPNRQFEVQWRASHAAGGDPIDVRAVLHEGSDEITLCYVDTTTGTPRDDGAFATAGVQATDTVALEYSCRTGSLTEDKVVRFLHP